mmetsp:Transcript_38124/g.109965  ORF Transcript_38124/g.109965 Transcript_38124/m.109965 type:complete len:363 (-) Transcript_38124:158-1246(-)
MVAVDRLLASGRAGNSEDKRGHRAFATYDLPEWVQHPRKVQPLKVAVLFPGEQNHSVGMLKGVRRRPAVRTLLDVSAEVLGFDLEGMMLEGPARAMVPPKVNEPLMFVADCVAYEVLKEMHGEVAERCQAVAGFGVGEIAALYAAGVLTFRQGLQIVKARAEALQEFSNQREMEALMIRGCPLDKLERHMKAAQKLDQDGEVHIARHDCPEGYLCAGRRSTVVRLHDLLAAEAGIQVRLLPDHLPATYTPMAAQACERVATVVRAVIPKMKPPRCELYLNKTGSRVPKGRSPETFASALLAQLGEAIQWESCVTQMLNWGIRQFYECGPNRSLRFLMISYEHLIEAPLEIVRPGELTVSIAV